jgi:hypothetical protein
MPLGGAVALAWAMTAAAGPPPPGAPGTGLAGLLAVEVEYRAHKLIFTMTTKARLSLIPVESVRDSLRPPPAGTPVPLPPETVASLTVETDLPFGRRDVTHILLDPRTGAALQTDKLTTVRGASRSVTRYLTGGVYTWRSWPASRSEERLGPQAWTRRSERFTPYPAALSDGVVVTDGYALLPLAEMARLDRPGATLHLYVPSYHRFLALDFVPLGFERRDVDIREESPVGVTVQDGPRLVRAVGVFARAVGGTGRETPHELGILGFQGGVTLLVDARTGVPLALTGRADYIGTLTARLIRVRYAYDPPEGEPTSLGVGRR